MADKWGPFNGRQLATMFVATMAFAGSGAVWAVAPSAVNPFSYVAIEDPVSGNKAAVDVGRHLIVFDQLQAVAANPANFFQASAKGGDCRTVATSPAGRALVIKTIATDAYDVPAAGAGHSARYLIGPAGDCGAIQVYDVNPGSIGADHVNFEPGFVVPATWVLYASLAGISGEIYVTGYTIPAAWAPPPPAVASADAIPAQNPR
jgi:hypothetical protein